MTIRPLDLQTLDTEQLLNGIKAPETIRAYTIHWKSYIAFCGHHGPPDEAETLTAWRQHLVNSTKESANTINLRLAAIKSIFRELADGRRIAKEVSWAINEVKKLPANALPARRRKNNRVRIEPTQMRALIETPNIQLGDPVGARDRALLLLFATSGLRASEAVKVRVEDIRQQGKQYMILNVLGKGQAQPRVAPLSEEAYLAIQDWLFMRPTQSEWIFTSIAYTDQVGLLYSESPMSYSSAYHTVKKVARAAKLPTVKPHDLRRFVGTQLTKRGDIRQAQRVLGHASINTTAKHYVLDDVPLGSTEGLF